MMLKKLNWLLMIYDSFNNTYILKMIFVVSFVVMCKYSGLNGQARFMRIEKTNQKEYKEANPHISLDFDLKKRNEWILKIADLWSKGQIGSEIEEIEPSIYDLPDLQKISYRIIGSWGLIKCRDKKTIVIGVHSSHEDPLIGDVSVAFLEDSSIFVNTGHVCGNIIHFMHLSSLIPADTEEFLNNFYSDTDQISWQKWQHFPSKN